jgi:hypothetical protein
MLDRYRDHLKLVLAFHNDITASKGTRDMMTIALKAGFPVRLFTEQGEVNVEEAGLYRKSDTRAVNQRASRFFHFQ